MKHSNSHQLYYILNVYYRLIKAIEKEQKQLIKMEVGDIVITNEAGKLGVIIAKYSNPNEHTGTWDWEVMCLKGLFPSGCKQDCFKESTLKIIV